MNTSHKINYGKINGTKGSNIVFRAGGEAGEEYGDIIFIGEGELKYKLDFKTLSLQPILDNNKAWDFIHPNLKQKTMLVSMFWDFVDILINIWKFIRGETRYGISFIEIKNDSIDTSLIEAVCLFYANGSSKKRTLKLIKKTPWMIYAMHRYNDFVSNISVKYIYRNNNVYIMSDDWEERTLNLMIEEINNS